MILCLQVVNIYIQRKVTLLVSTAIKPDSTKKAFVMQFGS